LRELDISYNDIEEFPENLADLKNMKLLFLQKNPFWNKVDSEITFIEQFRRMGTNVIFQ
jgi:Leucine-rich repeat (LRR) protein